MPRNIGYNGTWFDWLRCARLLIRHETLQNYMRAYQVICTEQVYTRCKRKEDMQMSTNKIRIRLKAYDLRVLDVACGKY